MTQAKPFLKHELIRIRKDNTERHRECRLLAMMLCVLINKSKWCWNVNVIAYDSKHLWEIILQIEELANIQTLPLQHDPDELSCLVPMQFRALNPSIPLYSSPQSSCVEGNKWLTVASRLGYDALVWYLRYKAHLHPQIN